MNHNKLTGRNLHAPSNQVIENATGATIPKFTCVTWDGIGVNFPIVRVSLPTDVTRGITQRDVLDDHIGIVTSLGFMDKVDTTAWAMFDKLYCQADGSLATTPVGVPVAQVMKVDPKYGQIFVFAVGISIDDIEAAIEDLAVWSQNGNSNTTASDFLGTIDAKPLRIKTNSIPRLIITETGRFGFGDVDPQASIHYKFHANGDARTGKLFDTFSVTSDTDTWANAYVIPMNPNSNIMVEIDIVARQKDGAHRASLKRMASFNKLGAMSSTFQDGPEQSSYTQRTHPDFDLQFITTLNAVIVQIKNPLPNETFWVGSINTHVVILEP